MAGSRTLVLLYAAVAVAGTALPLWAFLPWLAANGPDLTLFAVELFASRVSSFFALDVIVSALVLTVFIVVQGGRDRVALRWLAVVATFLIGVSCGLPLFLALRERALASAR